jgi:hypothetical protein
MRGQGRLVEGIPAGGRQADLVTLFRSASLGHGHVGTAGGTGTDASVNVAQQVVDILADTGQFGILLTGQKILVVTEFTAHASAFFLCAAVSEPYVPFQRETEFQESSRSHRGLHSMESA